MHGGTPLDLALLVLAALTALGLAVASSTSRQGIGSCVS
jgi:hypothetical protein